jgi:hypothetical protein
VHISHVFVALSLLYRCNFDEIFTNELIVSHHYIKIYNPIVSDPVLIYKGHDRAVMREGDTARARESGQRDLLEEETT